MYECLKAPMHATLNNTIDDLYSFQQLDLRRDIMAGK